MIALVDCNSFYCSCERLFRPSLLARPVGVLSNNDGCFVSRTRELKQLGVPMGAPYFKYKELCRKNNVAVFSANFSLYTNLSDRVMETLSKFAPDIEVYSVDEAFIDLSGFRKESIEKYCREIKKRVEKDTGIPVSVGVGETKTLAKVANHIAKNTQECQGVYSVLSKKNKDNALSKTSVGSVWGIGKRKALEMGLIRIKTAKDLADYRNTQQIQKLFTKVTRQTQDELNGIKCFQLTYEGQKKKEIISSRTFGMPVFNLEKLQESVASYASLACEKLRKQGSVAGEVTVWVRTNPFKEDISQYYGSDTYILPSHTSDTRRIIKYAWKALDNIYVRGHEYKKALVKLGRIRDKNETQLSLFCPHDSLEDENLMQVMDQINTRDGHGTAKIAACGLNSEAWQMKQALKSPRYLSGWSELMEV